MGGILLNPYSLGAAAYSPVSEGNCVLWLDGAVGATVSQWSDQSGSNNHATQATGGDQASVSGGAYTFNGTSSHYDLASNITVPDDGFSAYVVFDRAGTGDRGFFSGTTSAAACLRISGDNKATMLRSHATDTGSSTTAVADAKVLLAVTWTINLRSFFENGAANGTNSSTVGSFGAINLLGCDFDGANPGDFFNGLLYEVVLFSDAHDATTRGRVESYLMTKHGL